MKSIYSGLVCKLLICLRPVIYIVNFKGDISLDRRFIKFAMLAVNEKNRNIFENA